MPRLIEVTITGPNIENVQAGKRFTLNPPVNIAGRTTPCMVFTCRKVHVRKTGTEFVLHGCPSMGTTWMRIQVKRYRQQGWESVGYGTVRIRQKRRRRTLSSPSG